MKKIIIRIAIVLSSILIISLLGFWYVYDNLKTYSVYYAQHMPRGEGEEPELIMLIDNLEWIVQPDIEGIEYDIDGTNTIIESKDIRRMFGNIFYEGKQYTYTDKNGNYYKFNKKFIIVYASDINYTKIKPKEEERKRVIKEIKDLVYPVIKAQRKPDVNLQFIFNWLYEDEFK